MHTNVLFEKGRNFLNCNAFASSFLPNSAFRSHNFTCIPVQAGNLVQGLDQRFLDAETFRKTQFYRRLIGKFVSAG